MPIGAVEHFFDITWSPLKDGAGDVVGILTFAVDVTVTVAAREALKAAVAQLQAERDVREQFVATLSHDLRTPLSSAGLAAHLLSEGEADPTEVAMLARRIIRNVQRTDEMITNLLDAGSMKVGETLPIRRERCLLDRVVADALEDLVAAHGDRFAFSPGVDVEGSWDPKALRRILENLCGNAVKYGDRETPITVSLTLHGDAVDIAVHNAGPPIAAVDQGTLFDSWRRTGSAARGNQRGWGLGLTVVRGLASSHGGTVTVESDVARGTTFVVTLPLGAPIDPT